ncbi:MAG: hypothetical protein GX772_08125 [Alcaligenaceae bacterium]|nr:hypothetical protein [Alcaligenaceae bacterium]
MKRKLTITTTSDWKTALREAGAIVSKGIRDGKYQGESLNFETPGAFFSRLTPNRWAMVAELQGAGEVGVRELARRLGRDVKRVHEDAAALVEVGLLEKAESGALICPYADIHVDMHMGTKAA